MDATDHWACMQAPAKVNACIVDQELSNWIELFQKDVECTFGILKGQFCMLMTDIRLEGTVATLAFESQSFCCLCWAASPTCNWMWHTNMAGVEVIVGVAVTQLLLFMNMCRQMCGNSRPRSESLHCACSGCLDTWIIVPRCLWIVDSWHRGFINSNNFNIVITTATKRPNLFHECTWPMSMMEHSWWQHCSMLMTSLLPNKVLQHVHCYLRRTAWKPFDMTVKGCYMQIMRINWEEIHHLPLLYDNT